MNVRILIWYVVYGIQYIVYGMCFKKIRILHNMVSGSIQVLGLGIMRTNLMVPHILKIAIESDTSNTIHVDVGSHLGASLCIYIYIYIYHINIHTCVCMYKLESSCNLATTYVLKHSPT